MSAQQQLINNLKAKFPDIEVTGTATREQITSCISYIPAWLQQRKVSRGIYSIPGTGSAVAAKPQQAVMQSVEVDLSNVESLIPQKDPNFVPFGNYQDVEQVIKSRSFYPMYIYGPTGNGKSTMVEQICAKHKRPLIRINLTRQTDDDALIGTRTLEDGNVKVVEGPLLIAMRTGSVALLDEIDAADCNNIMCLQAILEGKPYYFKPKNEMIVPAPGFTIIATANTKGKGSDDGRYIGTNILNEAFLERFALTFEQEYPQAKTEMKIINNIMELHGCVNEKFADSLIKWAEAIRRTFDDGGVDENITTRRLIHIVKAFAVFKDEKKAVQLCCNRFDVATKAAFLDLYDKIAGGEEIEPAQPPVTEESLPF